MSQHEAARTPDQSGDAATTNGGATPPAAPSPRHDERPRPQYGEYAPEGWTWTPPVDERAAAADAANAESAAALAPAAPAAPSGAAAARAHPIDRMWTIALLIFGVFGALYNSLALFQLPATALESAKLSASMLGVDGPADFTPGPAVPVFIFIGIALQLALWVGALLWSRARMRASRLAWWVPLLAGVAAFIVVVVVGMLVFTSDPTFLPLSPAQP
ncbi:hypothetical protein JOE59_002091 [Agromyces cerinus]|uniref:DUF6264 family protein n=1 Tax=Agromyces cerinus TaxID=33878 RepID=UPI00195D5F79|nr:DUF6264 family protein [Agromyces cerinus]MBM7831386.1 hypothetical protein [Agromyces cerinus]